MVGLFFTKLGVLGVQWASTSSVQGVFHSGISLFYSSLICIVCPMPFIHLVKTVFFATSRNQPQIIVEAKTKQNKTKPALSASLFQQMVKNWGGASHLKMRNKSSEFKERINLVHSLCKILLDSVDYKILHLSSFLPPVILYQFISLSEYVCVCV